METQEETIGDLVECMVGKEEKEATHVPDSCQDQQHSRSECYPMLPQKCNIYYSTYKIITYKNLLA